LHELAKDHPSPHQLGEFVHHALETLHHSHLIPFFIKLRAKLHDVHWDTVDWAQFLGVANVDRPAKLYSEMILGLIQDPQWQPVFLPPNNEKNDEVRYLRLLNDLQNRLVEAVGPISQNWVRSHVMQFMESLMEPLKKAVQARFPNDFVITEKLEYEYLATWVIITTKLARDESAYFLGLLLKIASNNNRKTFSEIEFLYKKKTDKLDWIDRFYLKLGLL
jgi:hypothetical protein